VKRRDFVSGLGSGAVAAGLAACGQPAEQGGPGEAVRRETFKWKMVTTWPPNFPGLGTGAANLAKMIERASGGRITVRVYAAGELVPAFEVFDAVSQGTADIGHGGAYYWKGKVEAAQFAATVPFGLNAAEMNGWLYYGDGLKLWSEIYAPFNLVPFPAGTTGTQMGGWFNKAIDSPADIVGLKMRIPGLGGEVFRKAGGTPVSMPGSEIFTSLQTGSIDATEWVGPYNDLAFGLHKAARYYYYPGWHEPGPILEAMINGDSWNALPEDLQHVVRACCQAINGDVQAEFTYRNAEAYQQILADPNVEVRRFPDEVLRAMRGFTDEVVAEITARNPDAKRIYESLDAFRARSAPFQRVSEQAFLETREIPR
jgi:TRAP-type mannitol/chloroaromatic compound transport system substrate-binding protein